MFDYRPLCSAKKKKSIFLYLTFQKCLFFYDYKFDCIFQVWTLQAEVEVLVLCRKTKVVSETGCHWFVSVVTVLILVAVVLIST